ncbi:hypothetical protein AVV02_gp194 [Bacillus phage AvesoBmore]|uniref:Uncharacterized protein n=1 Tax=Bacillus phage AvesoBmore TaxID=1698451 RepID=A0A0K2D0V9_9CAUD|nr:hypothetical protein AVV02_gp194 [Bacillus phage AvesoBmore]ALA13358.1 hypothetical protein AVESOBMORE_194 [Bacillus phage AvesoBmore]
MNFYREIRASELIDKINLAFEEYGITDFDDKIKIEKAIKFISKNAAKRAIKETLPEYDYHDVNDLLKTLDGLYKALGLINAGQKVYTDL